MIKNKNYNIYEEKRGKGETRVQAKGEGGELNTPVNSGCRVGGISLDSRATWGWKRWVLLQNL